MVFTLEVLGLFVIIRKRQTQACKGLFTLQGTEPSGPHERSPSMERICASTRFTLGHSCQGANVRELHLVPSR